VIFVGAGLSQGAGLPGWDELIRGISDELPGCPEDADYRDVAQYYVNEYGDRRLVEVLRTRLDTLAVRPTAVHRTIIRLPVDCIFTTNYDDLLEQALRAIGQTFALVVDTVDASFLNTDQLRLVKVHGDLQRPSRL